MQALLLASKAKRCFDLKVMGGFNVNYTDLMSAVKLMGQGMLAIFAVMAAIAIIVYLFTKFSK